MTFYIDFYCWIKLAFILCYRVFETVLTLIIRYKTLSREVLNTIP